MAEVNLDVAMQSTSEEILEKVQSNNEKRNTMYVYTTTKTATHTPLSVTGKGRFYWMQPSIYITANTTSTVTIIIDGTTILTAKLKNSYSNDSSQYCLVHNESKMVGTTTENYPAYFFPLGAGNRIWGSNVNVNVSQCTKLTETTAVSETSSSNYGLQFYVNEYLEFKESLVIKATGCSTNNISYWTICYDLEE